MITVEYVQTMARYNAWQNKELITRLTALPHKDLVADRGAFFGSVFGTLNHLLWGDRLWMSRFDGWTAPEGGIKDSPTLYPTFAAWQADRVRADGRLIHWGAKLRPAQLRGDLAWFSGALGRDVSKPIAFCVTHMFNHQTHHRGQVHAMLTAMGVATADSDLFVMPETVA